MAERRAFIAGGLMLSVSAFAAVREPTRKLSASLPPLRLAEAIPEQFAGWRVDNASTRLVASPDVEEQIQRLYSQLVSRTYTNGDGARVMLVVAYGEDQADATTQVHQPEKCYASQGFEVYARGAAQVTMGSGRLPVVRLFATQRTRLEPITYWTTVADRALNTETERRLERARYALAGQIPDGMLVRVSTIDADEGRAYATHARFIADAAEAVAPLVRPRIFGREA